MYVNFWVIYSLSLIINTKERKVKWQSVYLTKWRILKSPWMAERLKMMIMAAIKREDASPCVSKEGVFWPENLPKNESLSAMRIFYFLVILLLGLRIREFAYCFNTENWRFVWGLVGVELILHRTAKLFLYPVRIAKSKSYSFAFIAMIRECNR